MPFLLLVLIALLPPSAQARTLFSPAEKNELAVSYLSRAEVNEAIVAYGIGKRHSLGLHGIRNHWPQKTELHYALLRLDSRIAGEKTENMAWRIHVITGLGLANKLNGIDRLASQLGLEGEVESVAVYFGLRGYTLAAKDFDRKNFVRARAGFHPYAAGTGEPTVLFFLQGQYENLAQHRIEWGPGMRFTHRNVGLELYGNFKGNWSFAFGFVY